MPTFKHHSMKSKRNASKETEKIIEDIRIKKTKPTLLLHSCCAPCSSYVLEYLVPYFSITIFYDNPNLDSSEEYRLRSKEQIRLVQEMQLPIEVVINPYEPDVFFKTIQGLENEPEGGKRCLLCFYLRLKRTAEYAKFHGFDYFTTTLSISPLKNSDRLNSIGEAIANKMDLKYLVSDFKKKNGYIRSTQLSKEHSMYRQDYCGCIFSRNERDNRIK